MFSKKPIELTESNLLAIQLVEMALETYYRARVWPCEVNIESRKAVYSTEEKLYREFTLSMRCILQLAHGVEAVDVSVRDLRLVQPRNGRWYASEFGASFHLVDNREGAHRDVKKVQWEYPEDSRFPLVKFEYDWDGSSPRYYVGHGLTSGEVWRETRQSGAWDHTRYDVLKK